MRDITEDMIRVREGNVQVDQIGYAVGLSPARLREMKAAEAWVKTQLSEAATEPPAMIVDSMIPAGMVGSIYGGPGEGKTLLAVYLALQAMRRGFRVAILDKENGARIMRERFEMMGADLEALERDGLIAFYDHPPAGADPETVAAFVAMLEAEKPDLIVIDAWVGFLGSCGFEENSSTDIAAWSDLYTTPARSRGIAVLLLDHRPKDGTNKTARGSSRKRDYVDFQYELDKAGVIDRENIGTITLKKTKDRGAWLKNVHQFRVGGTPSGFVFEPIDAPHDPAGDGLSDGDQAALDALAGGGLTYSGWMKAHGGPETTFKRHRKALVDAGTVYKDGSGLYWPTGKGPRGPNGGHGPSGPSKDQDRTARGHGGHHPRGGPVAPPDGGPVRKGSAAIPNEDFDSSLHRQNPQQGSEDKGGSDGAPGPDNLPSPDGGSAPGSRHGGDDVVGRARDEGVDPSVGPRERRLTTEELAYYHQLRREGVDPEEARAKVLGGDDGMRS